MKELLCSILLLIWVGAGATLSVGQDYDERPRSARRPIATVKTIAKDSLGVSSPDSTLR